MSGFLITSSFVTTLLIPPAAFEGAGRPAGGVLVLMSSASVAVTLSARSRGRRRPACSP
jgi:hypothetical protein